MFSPWFILSPIRVLSIPCTASSVNLHAGVMMQNHCLVVFEVNLIYFMCTCCIISSDIPVTPLGHEIHKLYYIWIIDYSHILYISNAKRWRELHLWRVDIETSINCINYYHLLQWKPTTEMGVLWVSSQNTHYLHQITLMWSFHYRSTTQASVRA